MIYFDAVRTVAPQLEPVSVSEFAAAWPSYIEADATRASVLLSAARESVEKITGLVLLQSTWEFSAPAFPRVVTLPRAPVRSITKIEYYNTGGTLTELNAANYRLHTRGVLPQVTPTTGNNWPLTESHRPDAVLITAVLGCFADDAGSPNAIDYTTNPQMVDRYAIARECIIRLAGLNYDEKGDLAPTQLHEIPFGLRHLLAQITLEHI